MFRNRAQVQNYSSFKVISRERFRRNEAGNADAAGRAFGPGLRMLKLLKFRDVRAPHVAAR